MHEPAVHAWCQLTDAVRDCQTSLEAALAGSQQAVATALEHAQIEISKVKQRRGSRGNSFNVESDSSIVESKTDRRSSPFASLSIEQRNVGPANEAVRWIQGRLWDFEHAGRDALARFPKIRREEEKKPDPGFLVRKNQTARLSRTLEFWQRSVLVYSSYKVRLSLLLMACPV